MAKRTGTKRTHVRTVVRSVKLDVDCDERVNEMAKTTGIKPATLMRIAIERMTDPKLHRQSIRLVEQARLLLAEIRDDDD